MGMYVLDWEIDSFIYTYVERSKIAVNEYFYDGIFEDSHQGSNPFEGYTAKNEEGLLIDKRADELRQLLQATRPTAPKAQPVTAP